MNPSTNQPAESDDVIDDSGPFPRRFGPRHVLLKELGRGRFGTVDLAWAGGRLVAVKRLQSRGQVSDTDQHEEFARRFADEVALLSRLHHPNVVYVAEASVDAGEPYLVLEYVRGKTLSQVWRRCADLEMSFPLGLALHVARELLRALGYLHGLDDQDVVHRDVAPTNVLVSYAGELKLSDFGLSRWRDRGVQTVIGEAWDTGPYMSPEHRSGARIDGRADLWSVGAILWELVTGRSIEAVVPPGKPLPRPSQVLSQVPPALDALIMTAVAPRPDDRFPTASAFAAQVTMLMTANQDVSRVAAFMSELFEDDRDRADEQEKRLVGLAKRLLAMPDNRPVVVPPPIVPAKPAPSQPKPVVPPLPAEPSATMRVSPPSSHRRAMLLTGIAGLGGGLLALGTKKFFERPHAVGKPRAPIAAAPAPTASIAASPKSAVVDATFVEPAPRRDRRASRSLRVERLLDRAEAAYQESKLVEAMDLALSAVAVDNSVQGRLLLGKIYLQLERPVDALKQYEIVLRIHPDNDPALRGQALAKGRAIER